MWLSNSHQTLPRKNNLRSLSPLRNSSSFGGKNLFQHLWRQTLHYFFVNLACTTYYEECAAHKFSCTSECIIIFCVAWILKCQYIYFFTEMQKLPTILQAATTNSSSKLLLLLCQTHHKNQEVSDSSNLLITVPTTVETTSHHRVQPPMLNQMEYWRILTTETPCLEWDRGM